LKYEGTGWYLIGVGSAMVIAGLWLWRPAPGMRQPRVSRIFMGLAAIVLGHAPDSWLPWGLAFVLMGVGVLVGQPAENPLAGLAFLSLAIGIAFLARPPSRAQGRAIHAYLREFGIDRKHSGRRRDDA
jgi:hypothetical protein